MNIFESLNNQIESILEGKQEEADKETLRKGLLGFLNQFGNELSIDDIQDDTECVPHLTTFKIEKEIEPYHYSNQFAITTSENVLLNAVKEYIENEEDDMGGFAVLNKYGYIDMGIAEEYIQPNWFIDFFKDEASQLFTEYLNEDINALKDFCEQYGINLSDYGYDEETDDIENIDELKKVFIEKRLANYGKGSEIVDEYIGQFGIESLEDAFAKGAKIKADAIAKQYFEENMMEQVFASVEEVADYYDGTNYFWILVL